VALLSIADTVLAQGQPQSQVGYVRTIGRPGKPGVPVPDAVIRWRGTVNATRSAQDGRFSTPMPGKRNGDPIVLQSVSKAGYELKDKGLIGRQQAFSTQVPIEIVMVNIRQLEADKERIEKNAYKTAELNYKKRLNQLQQQIDKQEITIEQYRQELDDLEKKYESYQALISEMADRYARTDYDKLDSIDYHINMCIEDGQLEKADSLIHTVFDPETVLERNRAAKQEIEQRKVFAQSVIDKALADKAAILRDLDYARRVVTLSNNLADEFLVQGDTGNAIECLEKSLEILTIIDGEDSEQAKLTRRKLQALTQ
jgi:hypothetical protein